MIFKRRFISSRGVFVLIAIVSVALGIDITIDYDEYLVSESAVKTVRVLLLTYPNLITPSSADPSLTEYC